MGRWDDYEDTWNYYRPGQPIKVEGGLKARSKQGAIGSTWWSRRWIHVLESFSMGTRLTRGRSYARQGQVVSMEVQPGLVQAQVQGSQPKPYTVGLGYSNGFLLDFRPEPHDVPLDALLNEQGVVWPVT